MNKSFLLARLFLCILFLIPPSLSRTLLRQRKLQATAAEEEDFDQGPRAISNVILSAVKTDKIDEASMATALESGMSRAQIDNLVRLAVDRARTDGNILRIEEDMAKIRELKIPPKPKQPRNEYIIGKGWTLSSHQHKLISIAVLTAIRSPTKTVDEDAVEAAIASGVDRDLIMRSVAAATTKKRTTTASDGSSSTEQSSSSVGSENGNVDVATQ
mmetsp:Transcript_8492/g.12287  ORF Transcript_8492/g.12287 Transcript_8492/m.12287 type:complete len:215 (-) Transcript_8492:26-670(-)